MNKCYSLHPWEEEPENIFCYLQNWRNSIGIRFAELSSYGLVAVEEDLTAASSLETNSFVSFIVTTCTVCFPPI